MVNRWSGIIHERITNNVLSFGIDVLKTKNQIVMFDLSGFLIARKKDYKGTSRHTASGLAKALVTLFLVLRSLEQQ
jgi:hypothetical protein